MTSPTLVASAALTVAFLVAVAALTVASFVAVAALTVAFLSGQYKFGFRVSGQYRDRLKSFS